MAQELARHSTGTHRGQFITGVSAKGPLFQPVRGGHEKISWGKPAQIAVALIDKRCPRCNASTKEDLGLDLGIEDGRVFGGRCQRCEWSF